jgi:TRAP-type C4-dicarboxylate transport system permease small subunit
VIPLERVARATERVVTWWIVTALAVMVLTIVSDVILRETFDYPLTFNLEVAQSCLINLTYVGAALAFRLRAHISINTVTARLPVKVEKWVDVFARCLVLPFFGILAYSGLQVLQKAKGVTPTLRLPIWMYYFPIFIGSILLCFYGVVQVLEAIEAARSGGKPVERVEVPKGAI